MLTKNKFIQREKDGRITSNAFSIEVFIPRSYFTDGIAEIIGDKLNTIGIFEFRVVMVEGGKPINHALAIPNPIVLSYSKEYTTKENISSEADTEEEGEDEEDSSFRVFVIEKGETFLESESIVIGSANLEGFVKLLHSGKLPKTTYEMIYKLYMDVQKSNKTTLGVSSSTLEAIIAELCRWKKDHSIPFRIALKKDSTKDTDFEMVSLKTLPELISAFSGVSFENINRSLLVGINNKRLGKEDRMTPMEQIIRG
jgi:hypothetical protein